MAAQPPADDAPRKRRWPRYVAFGVAGGATVIAAAGAIVLGPAGPNLAATLSNNRDIWRLGKLNVEGVQGRGLGDLQVTRATLSDDQGVWAIAEDLRVKWEPLKLLTGDVALQDVGADKLIILRRPNLAPAREAGPVTIDTNVAAIGIERVEIAKDVAGPAALFKFAGAVVTHHGAIEALRVDFVRQDAPLDSLKINFAKAPNLTLDAILTGKPGGTFSYLIEAPKADLEARARATTDPNGSGAASLVATLGAMTAAQGNLAWSTADWRLAGVVHFDAIPVASDLAKRFGPVAELSASGAAPKPAGAPFSAVLASQSLSGEARGKLDDELKAVGAVALVLSTQRFGQLVPETDLEAGGARFDGAIEFEGDRTRLSGRAALDGWRRNGFALAAEGPLEIISDKTKANFDADLASDRVTTDIEPLARLMRSPRFTIKGRFDRTENVWTFERLAAIGPDLDIHGAGTVKDGKTLFKGELRAPHMGVAFADMKGAVQGDWVLQSAARGFTLGVNADGRNFSGASPVVSLLGGAPKFEAKLSFAGVLSKLDSARLNGRALRIGAFGTLSGAPTDVKLEASARGPIDIATMRLTGALDATGHVTGSLDAPRLHMEALLGGLDVAGMTLEKPKIGLDLAPENKGQGGRVTLDAALMGKPLSANARMSLIGDRVAFDDLDIKAARIEAKGRAAFSSAGPEADVSLAGAIDGLVPRSVGAIAGQATLTSVKGKSALRLNAYLSRARFGPRLAADTMSIHAAGPLENMITNIALEGWAGDDKLVLHGDGASGLGKQGLVISMNANGEFAGAPIATRAPLVARMDGPLLEANAALTLGAGKADISWRGERDRLSAAGSFDDAPLTLLTAFLDQPMAGTIDGEIKLFGGKKSLEGDGDFTLTNARLARRSSDSVDATIKAHLGGGLLKGRIDAKSGAGLTAFAEGQTPVIAEAAPFRFAPAKGRGQAHWQVNGPVEGLWALFGPLDQALAGKLDGAGDMQFGADGISGTGALTLAAGSFEDKQSGVKLRQIDARVSFDDKGMRLEKFDASDGKQGRVSGSGRLDGPNNGHLDLTLTNMRLVDRADAKAIGGGAVAVEWKNGGAVMTGDIALTDAEVRAVGSNAAIAVPVIDVVEINRPGPPPRPIAPASAIPVTFDVRIHAPGRVFTRTRGLDAEWALDIQLKGDAKTPILLGTATLMRGSFTLAGRRFDLDSGEIKFSGAPDDADLNIIAVADTPDLSVRAAITGRAADPEIALSSEPALPEDEILPQLLFGRSTRELSGFEAAQLAASLATLAGQSAFDIAGAARTAVDLDRLEFRQDSAGGFLVSGGKYLTRDVFLEVARGSLGETTTAVEWQVKPRFFVISSFNTTGDQRVAVRWKHDY